MATEREIIYTDAAKEKMASAKDYYARELERRILEMRYVPGDEMVEITASDIEHAHRRMTARVPFRISILSRAATVYVLGGLGAGIMGMMASVVYMDLGASSWPTWLAFGGMLVAVLGFILQKVFESRLKYGAQLDAPIERASDLRQGEALNAYFEEMSARLRQEIAREVRPTVETQRMLAEDLVRLAEAIRDLQQHQTGGQGGQPNSR